jgi:hypothetical protein
MSLKEFMALFPHLIYKLKKLSYIVDIVLWFFLVVFRLSQPLLLKL